MGSFKGWAKVSHDTYVAELGMVGSIKVSRSSVSGRWTASAIDSEQLDLETAIGAKATAVQMAFAYLDTIASQISREDLVIALDRLDQLKIPWGIAMT